VTAKIIAPGESQAYAMVRRLVNQLNIARIRLDDLAGKYPDEWLRIDRDIIQIDAMLEEAGKALEDREKFYMPRREQP